MMTCARCKKRPAVVFITRVDNGETTNEGYCLSCAKELGIQPVNDMLKKFGISDEDMEQMEEQMTEFLQHIVDRLDAQLLGAGQTEALVGALLAIHTGDKHHRRAFFTFCTQHHSE